MAAGRKKVSEALKMQIGKRMEQAARQAGFTSGAEVAEALQIAQPTVSRWWRGERLPEREEMARYADLVGRDPVWFELGQDLDEIVADKVLQIISMIQEGKAGSLAFDTATRAPEKLSTRERRQVDAGTPALRAHVNQVAGAHWAALPEEEQRQIVDRLAEQARHLAEE